MYQLPLDQFTPARNELAKLLKQPDIKKLEKPNIAAWAVNQLYWDARDAYERLTTASRRLRDEHRKLLSGKRSDIREAERLHRDVVRQTVEQIKSLLEKGGHPATEATLSAVQETLEALPAAGPPGRLTRPLKRLGFEALAGVAIAPAKASASRRSAEAKAEPASSAASSEHPLKLVKSGGDQEREREARQRSVAERERRARQAQAERALKTAEAAMLEAEEAVKKAERALGELRSERDEAVREYQRARLRARE